MNELEYGLALITLSALVSQDPDPETPQGHALDELSKACEEYEREHFPIAKVTAEAVAQWRRDEGLPP